MQLILVGEFYEEHSFKFIISIETVGNNLKLS